jgi:hypothetical protein
MPIQHTILVKFMHLPGEIGVEIGAKCEKMES